jgi:hypothetical protein
VSRHKATADPSQVASEQMKHDARRSGRTSVSSGLTYSTGGPRAVKPPPRPESPAIPRVAQVYGSPWGRRRKPSDPAYLDAGHSGVASIRGHYQAEWQRWEWCTDTETDCVSLANIAERGLCLFVPSPLHDGQELGLRQRLLSDAGRAQVVERDPLRARARVVKISAFDLCARQVISKRLG